MVSAASILNAAPYIVAGALALGAGGYYIHCEHVKEAREKFIEELSDAALMQETKNKAIIAENELLQEIADATAEKLRADLRAVSKRLRDERARTSVVPAAPADSKRPEIACFDRAELDAAVGKYRTGVLGIAEKGAAFALELDVSRKWANEALQTLPKREE